MFNTNLAVGDRKLSILTLFFAESFVAIGEFDRISDGLGSSFTVLEVREF